MEIKPEEKAIALGGVPTGIMNPQLAAKVSGIHKLTNGMLF